MLIALRFGEGFDTRFKISCFEFLNSSSNSFLQPSNIWFNCDFSIYPLGINLKTVVIFVDFNLYSSALKSTCAQDVVFKLLKYLNKSLKCAGKSSSWILVISIEAYLNSSSAFKHDARFWRSEKDK